MTCWIVGFAGQELLALLPVPRISFHMRRQAHRRLRDTRAATLRALGLTVRSAATRHDERESSPPRRASGLRPVTRALSETMMVP